MSLDVIGRIRFDAINQGFDFTAASRFTSSRFLD